jgi:hypothetical protein
VRSGMPFLCVSKIILTHISHFRAVGGVVITLAYGSGVYEAHGKELTDLNRKALDQVTWVGGQLWLVEFLPIRE